MKMLLRFNCIVFFASSLTLCAVLRCYKREVAFAYAPAIHFLRWVERRWLISNCWAIMTGWLPNNHSCTLPNGRWWTPHAAPASLTIELSVLRGTLHLPVYLYLYLHTVLTSLRWPTWCSCPPCQHHQEAAMSSQSYVIFVLLTWTIN